MSKDVYLSFGATTGDMEAQLARAQAMVRATANEMRSLANQMQRSGATADSEMGQKLAALGEKMAQAKGALSGAREEVSKLGGVGAAAADGVDAVGKAANNSRVQMQMLVSGVSNTASSLGSGASAMQVLMQQGPDALQALAMGVSASAMSWAGVAAGVLAVAGAMGYAVYQMVAFKNSAEQIRSIAMIDQFQMTAKAAGDVAAAIAKAADVSYSTAQKIAQPFLELGPGGEKIAQISAYYVPLFVQALGVDAPKAAEALAKKFTDLKGEGSKYVSETVNMSSATKRLFDAYVQAGDKAKAWDIVLQALQTRLESGRQAVAEQSAATLDFTSAVAAAAAAEAGLDITQQLLEEQAKRTTAALDAQRVAMDKARSGIAADAESSKVLAAQKAEAADKIVENTNKESAEVQKLKAEYDQVVDRLKTIDQSTAEGYKATQENWAAQKRLQDQLREAQEREGGGLIPETAFERAQQQIKELEASWKGSRSGLIEQEQMILRMQQKGAGVPSGTREGRQFDDALAAKRKEAIDAESAAFSRGEDMKTAKAADQGAARLQQARNEATEKARLYGAGSDQAQQAAVALAQQERAAAEQRRADRVAEIDAEMADLRMATQEKLRDYADDVRNKRITVQQGAVDSVAALRAEQSALRAFYEEKKSLALTSAQDKRAIEQAEAAASRQIASQIKQQQRQAASDMAQAYRSVADQIASIVNSQVSGLLRGTVSVQEAMKNMVASAIEELIKLGIRIAIETAAMAVLRIVTGGTVGGGGAPFGLPIPGFASGTPYVASTGLALIHRGEAIIPAANNPFSANATAPMSAGGGATHYNTFTINPPPGSDSREIAAMVADMWNRNPSLRPAY